MSLALPSVSRQRIPGVIRRERRNRDLLSGAALLVLLLGADVAAAGGQDANLLLPVDEIERRLASEPFEVADRRPSRGLPGERTVRTAMAFADSVMMVAKWAPAPPGGERFNNVARYELAAYEIQKLFLDASEYVVPPTVIRAFPEDWYRGFESAARATLDGTTSVLVVLQYWLFNVTDEGVWDARRFAADPVYAGYFGNFNVLTYLIRHNDENQGNYLISRTEPPRVFAVDNGVAFASIASDRSSPWRSLRVDRLPSSTVDRLRAITYEELHRRLGALAEFQVLGDGSLEPVTTGPNLSPTRGVRRTDDRVQLGLTRREIDDLWRRLQALLGRVDAGAVGVFPWK